MKEEGNGTKVWDCWFDRLDKFAYPVRAKTRGQAKKKYVDECGDGDMSLFCEVRTRRVPWLDDCGTYDYWSSDGDGGYAKAQFRLARHYCYVDGYEPEEIEKWTEDDFMDFAEQLGIDYEEEKMRNDTYDSTHGGFMFDVMGGDLAKINIKDFVSEATFSFPHRFIKDIVEWMECEREGSPVEHKDIRYNSNKDKWYRQEKSPEGDYERIEIDEFFSFNTLEIRKSGDRFLFVIMNGNLTLQASLSDDFALKKMKTALKDVKQL